MGQRTFSTTTIAVIEKYINGRDLSLKMKVRDGKYYGLYKLIGNEDFLFGAYHMIRKNLRVSNRAYEGNVTIQTR